MTVQIQSKQDALYPKYKTVHSGEKMTNQKRRIEDRLPGQPLQWEEDTPVMQLAEKWASRQDADTFTFQRKYIADFAAALLATHAAPSAATGEPVAWAVFADNGNIRIWSQKSEQVERTAIEAGKPLVALYAHPAAPVQPALIAKMREMLGVQGQNGNWDCDHYMHGMYNGMEYMLAMVEGREPAFRDAPAKWLSDKLTTAHKPAFPERDPSKPAEHLGMFRKFDVRRVDGSDQPGGKHYGCRYFVLDLNHDQHAPAAMRAYAAACQGTHPQLADDIIAEFGATQASASAADRDAARYRFIEEHATMHGGGNGFTITCFVGADEEDMGVGIDKAMATSSAASPTNGAEDE